MRKRIVIVVLAVILAAFTLCGALMLQKADAASNMGFEVLYGGTWDTVRILYDRETGVMYVMSNGSYNVGTMTVMVNSDGTPRVYEGFAR